MELPKSSLLDPKKKSSLMEMHTPGSRGSPSVSRMKLSSVSQSYGYFNIGDSSSSDSEDEMFRRNTRIDFISGVTRTRTALSLHKK